MQTMNIAGYQFVALPDLPSLREHFLTECNNLAIKGTILLSHEGINLSLAGTPANIKTLLTLLKSDDRWADMRFRISYSDDQPFKRLKVKLKKEIISFRQPQTTPVETRAPSIDPLTLKQWLDEQRDFTLLDTRNDYEIALGSFKGAVNLHLKHFGDFANAANTVDQSKPVVMFCTGGNRCEKAALHMLNLGYQAVYQLDGGILNYFEKVGSHHYEGDCFVFDERVALDNNLKTIPSPLAGEG